MKIRIDYSRIPQIKIISKINLVLLTWLFYEVHINNDEFYNKWKKENLYVGTRYL